MSPGNALDKLARKLGLFQLDDNLPGGALVERYAQVGDLKRFGQLENTIKYYCGTNKSCDFSFSGIFSLALSIIDKELTQNGQVSMEFVADMCATFQNCVLYLLSDRIERGLTYYNGQLRGYSNEPLKVVLAGGVASNKYIFKGIQSKCNQYNALAIVPPMRYCTDNGVMIAWNGCEKLMANSNEIIRPGNKTSYLLSELRPQGKCDLGESIAREIEKFEIKLKPKRN
jgi:N6-L-threonylcarbamoyladenine synthase